MKLPISMLFGQCFRRPEQRQTQITASMAVKPAITKQQKSESQMDVDGLAMPNQIHLSAANFHQLSLLGLIDEPVLDPIIYLGPHCLCLSPFDTLVRCQHTRRCCFNFFWHFE